MTPQKKVNLKSIAKDLGITHTSVSNAYNNPAKVSSKLKDKILSYAKSVGYHGPNPAAKSLRTGRCGSIGVIFNDQLSYAFSDPHDIAFLRGVSTVCEEQGTNLVLVPLKHSELNDFESVDAMVDGYILNAPYKHNKTTQRALSKGVPIVVVDFDAPEHISVAVNDTKMMSEITEHILSLGHTKIGIVTFPSREDKSNIYTLGRKLDPENYVVFQRLKGCKQAISKTDIDMDTIYIAETSNNLEGGSKAVHALFTVEPDITAFICLSDTLAYGVMSECQKRDLHIPEQISVTGFDDIQPTNVSPSLPSLTTIRQDACDKGRKAAEALLKPKEVPQKQININAIMIIRESTASAKEI